MTAPELYLNPNQPQSAASERGGVEVRPLAHGEEGECDRFVTLSPSGTFFHLSGWRSIIEKTLGHKYICLVARRQGSVSGVLPVARVRSRLFGDGLVSLPLAVYGGICADDEESHAALLHAGSELAAGFRVKYLELRNRAERFVTSLPGRDLYVTFTQDLRPGPDQLLKNLPRDTRYAVRKSLKAALSWTEDLTDEEFYEIYARSVHRLGTPVFSRELFKGLRREFGAKCRLFGVRKGGAAIAGVLCFYFRNMVMPYYGGSLPEYYKDSPNNFMYWNLMVQSCNEGIQEFDFGRSKRGTGSYDFKSAWSMQVHELPYRYRLVGAKQVPQMSPLDKKFQLPVEIWKRLPFSWTKVLGPPLIRRVPSV